MSSFTKINKDRSRCNICNNIVANRAIERHLEYHTLGDMALSNDEVPCPLCLTPMSADGSNFKNHLKKFHNLPQAEANRINSELKANIPNRDTIDKMPKPTYVPPPKVTQRIQETKQETKQDAPRERPANFRPHLEGESDIDRERRLNREYVQKWRAKKRAERGLPPPKEYDRTIIEGETPEERERRKQNARVKAYRQRLKENRK